MPYAPPPEYQSPGPIPAPRPAHPAVVGNNVVAALVVAAVVMLFLGAMVMHYAPQVTNKDYTDDEAGEDQQDEDRRTVQTMLIAGRIVADVGAFVLIMILLLAAMLRSDWSDYVRFGVLFFVAVFAFSLGFRL